MENKYTERIEKIFNDRFSQFFYVINYPKNNGDGSYLWVFRVSTNQMIMVIHGGEYDTFEIKLIRADENNTVNKQFDTIEELERYIKKGLMDDMMIYEI